MRMRRVVPALVWGTSAAAAGVGSAIALAATPAPTRAAQRVSARRTQAAQRVSAQRAGLSARVEGRFSVSGRVSAATGVEAIDHDRRERYGWLLTGSGCRASACDRLSLRGPAGIGSPQRLTLTSIGSGRYRFSATLLSAGSCSARRLRAAHRSSIALALTVTRRRRSDGVWYATALTGVWTRTLSSCGVLTGSLVIDDTATLSGENPGASVTSTSPTATAPQGTSTAQTTTTFTPSTGTTAPSSTISSTPSPTTPTGPPPSKPRPERGADLT